MVSRKTYSEYVYCSNVDNMDSSNIPIWKVGDSRLKKVPGKGTIPGTTKDQVITSNWAIVRALSISGPPGARGASFKRPCTYWFGESYPKSELYERQPSIGGIYLRDRLKILILAHIFLSQHKVGFCR
jgi:hypothetical protein